jgi:hypothetical protein
MAFDKTHFGTRLFAAIFSRGQSHRESLVVYMRQKITPNRYIHTMKERIVAFWKMFSHFQKPNQEIKHVCGINY